MPTRRYYTLAQKRHALEVQEQQQESDLTAACRLGVQVNQIVRWREQSNVLTVRPGGNLTIHRGGRAGHGECEPELLQYVTRVRRRNNGNLFK
jgi:hypothetical protein